MFNLKYDLVLIRTIQRNMDKTNLLSSETIKQLKTTDCIIAFSAILAFVMNLFTLANLLSQQKLRRNKYHRAVLGLSVGDMIASVCAVHWFVRRFWIHADPTSDTECIVSFIVIGSSLQQTHLQMLLLAVERFLASRGTYISQRYCTLRIQIIYMTLSWVFCLTYMITSSLYHKMSGTNLCVPGQFAYFVDYRVGFVLAIPMILSMCLELAFYSLTLANIRKSSIRVGNVMNNLPSNMRYLQICIV